VRDTEVGERGDLADVRVERAQLVLGEVEDLEAAQVRDGLG